MYRTFKSFLLAAMLCGVFAPSVQAEIFFYENRDNGFTITFPDSWKRVTNQKADDSFTISAPGANDYATCRVRSRNDRRFVIYPSKFDSDIQKVEFSRNFWDQYLGEYNGINVDVFKDEAQIGQGFASMAEVSYETVEGPLVQKRGLMFASLFHDKLYVVECSSEQSVYDKWRPAFLSIVKSVNFADKRHPSAHGHYRSFDKDDKLEVLGKTKLDVYKF